MEDIYKFINKNTNQDSRCMELYLDLTKIGQDMTVRKFKRRSRRKKRKITPIFEINGGSTNVIVFTF